MSTILIIMITLSILFIFLNHPLSFGVILLIQTSLVSIITGMMNYNFWFSYILFLVMVGGMLILFIYMTSVASNEKFKLSYLLLGMSILGMIIGLLSSFSDQLIMNLAEFNYDLAPKHSSNTWSMSKFINFPMNKIMIMVITYLLVALIMVVKITNVQYGPMRQKF